MPTNKGNLFDGLPDEVPEELFMTLYEQPGLKIERIFSDGHSTPEGEWYDQDWDEWVLVIQGTGVILFADGAEETLAKGEYLFIPGRKKHRVLITAPKTLWLAVHSGGPGKKT